VRARADSASDVQRKDCERSRRIEKAEADFEKLGFGAGYGAVERRGGRPRIQEAEVVGGVVRVKEKNDVQFGPVLEAHRFFPLVRASSSKYEHLKNLTGCDGKLSSSSLPPAIIGVGPFVGLRVGDKEVVQTFALGAMLAFRKDDSEKSLNVGLGYAWDPRVRVLGDGIEEGAALPAGETQIRYKTTDQKGLMVLFSVGW
jgi:hypothetical protein